MQYALKRSNRKSLAAEITKEGIILVRAPLFVSQKEINSFLLENKQEILALRDKKLAQKKNLILDYDSKLTLLGKEYPIRSECPDSYGFDGDYFLMPSGCNSDQLKQIATEVYKEIAKNYIIRLTYELADELKLKFRSVRISNGKTSWGSCSSNKNININWRLIMAEEAVIKYIILHELSHLVELNHSEKYWKIVESHCPDYKQYHKKLKTLSHKITYEDWL